ncbi:hypothetical protein [Qipengyuania soli]|uniref:DUF2059 domain-containing protein n=1 Tax=Qipengyuania soli TaxID=2782568 RepID=A0A7S8ITY0_9SPHN|nr:hypothetical protein [Qipengyuania soli]QPC97862.1 hypothetical protein IRL76_08080 [Qipengyuania soli]
MKLLTLALPVLVLAAPLAANDDPKLALAREIAGHSLLATLGPLQTAAEVEQIIADAPDLTAQEQDDLRTIGREKAEEIGKRAIEAEAQAMAAMLTLEDLDAIASFERSPAAAHRREIMPMIVGSIMQELAGLDYKGEVRAAFCEQSGKLCE